MLLDGLGVGWGPRTVTDLCTISDVEALAGYTIPTGEEARVGTLIGMASAVVADSCVTLPTTTPELVTLVTAQLVVRQLANPTQATSEAIGAYHVGYAATGMMLTAADFELLGPWAKPSTGRGAYSVFTPSPYAVDSPGDEFIDAVPMGETP